MRQSSFLAFGLALATAVTGPVFGQAPPPSPTAQPAGPPPAPMTIIPFEAPNPPKGNPDLLGEARRIAATVVAQDRVAPKLVVDVGSFTGEFLEAFLDQIPTARGQWTEPVDNNRVNAGRRFARFGDRVDYVIGCAGRDISLGCVPKGVDVLTSSWLSIHQDLKGIQKFYKLAVAKVPSGGWVNVIDHVRSRNAAWDKRLTAARAVAGGKGLLSVREGPPVHHPDYVVPTLEDHLAAYKAAGILDARVVWRRLDTVLIMGRKP